MQEDETDEEERSMRRTSRTRRMRMTAALTTTTAMNDEKELSAQRLKARRKTWILPAGLTFALAILGAIIGSCASLGGGSLGVSIPTGPAS